MPNRRCEMCDQLSHSYDRVELHYLAKFEPLYLHHGCWQDLQRVEMKLRKISK
ncbi:MAG: hypothetical protein ABWY25_09595 [Paenisporosarcina sp.]